MLMRFAAAFLACAVAVLPASRAIAQRIPATARIESVQLMVPGVSPTPLRVRVHLPPGYRRDAATVWPVLYLNDGQDAEAVHLADALAELTQRGLIRPPIVVAIDMPPDRMGAYGFADRAGGTGIVAPTRYGDVGARAHAYSEWVVHTLVPFIDARYRTRATPDARGILGWSLGGANALSIGWRYPERFGLIGAFSPSLWLASDRTDAISIQRTRIGQAMVAGSVRRNGARFFFAVGTAEEADDRDSDGINDALDDTRDLVDGWNVDTGGLKGLRQAGYQVAEGCARQPRRADVALYVLDGGRHDQASWARMLPVFLRWAYAVRKARVEQPLASCRAVSLRRPASGP